MATRMPILFFIGQLLYLAQPAIFALGDFLHKSWSRFYPPVRHAFMFVALLS